MQKCENAGCCYDSYNKQCYDSSPAPQKIEPDTAECREVSPKKRESCGFGLSRDACKEMTGCCWKVDNDSNTFCYRSALFETVNSVKHVTNSTYDEKNKNVAVKFGEIQPQFPVRFL
jgi:hypothetical protein